MVEMNAIVIVDLGYERSKVVDLGGNWTAIKFQSFDVTGVVWIHDFWFDFFLIWPQRRVGCLRIVYVIRAKNVYRKIILILFHLAGNRSQEEINNSLNDIILHYFDKIIGGRLVRCNCSSTSNSISSQIYFTILLSIH